MPDNPIARRSITVTATVEAFVVLSVLSPLLVFFAAIHDLTRRLTRRRPAMGLRLVLPRISASTDGACLVQSHVATSSPADNPDGMRPEPNLPLPPHVTWVGNPPIPLEGHNPSRRLLATQGG